MPTAISSMRAPVPMWISGATYKRGVIVRSDVDLQTYIRKTNGAGTQDPAIDTANWQPESRRPEKSSQTVYVGFQGSSGTATIAAVNPAKCKLQNIGAAIAPGGVFETCLPYLTNATTLTVTRGGNYSYSSTVAIQITEDY